MSNTSTTVEDDLGYHPDRPTCDGYIPNNAQPGAYMGALSRRDNKTQICSDCGHREAMEEFPAARSRAFL